MARSTVTNAEGLFSAPALPAGDYEVRGEQPGFAVILRMATVGAGGSTTVSEEALI